MNSFFNQKNMIHSSDVTKSNVTMFFTGDVMLGRGVNGILAKDKMSSEMLILYF